MQASSKPSPYLPYYYSTENDDRCEALTLCNSDTFQERLSDAKTMSSSPYHLCGETVQAPFPCKWDESSYDNTEYLPHSPPTYRILRASVGGYLSLQQGMCAQHPVSFIHCKYHHERNYVHTFVRSSSSTINGAHERLHLCLFCLTRDRETNAI